MVDMTCNVFGRMLNLAQTAAHTGFVVVALENSDILDAMHAAR